MSLFIFAHMLWKEEMQSLKQNSLKLTFKTQKIQCSEELIYNCKLPWNWYSNKESRVLTIYKCQAAGIEPCEVADKHIINLLCSSKMLTTNLWAIKQQFYIYLSFKPMKWVSNDAYFCSCQLSQVSFLPDEAINIIFSN